MRETGALSVGQSVFVFFIMVRRTEALGPDHILSPDPGAVPVSRLNTS